MARTAYGAKENVASAIENGIIPKDCIIITKDDTDSEILFYDAEGNLKTLAERTRFETLTEAQQWANKYPCAGFVFTIHNGAEWVPYIVRDDNTLAPFSAEVTGITDIKRIDGGTSAGNI